MGLLRNSNSVQELNPLLKQAVETARSLSEVSETELEGLDEFAAARRALQLLANTGLLAWCVPERDGGAPAGKLATRETISVQALCQLRKVLSYGHGMLDLMQVMQGLGSYPIAMGGQRELRASVLPRVVRGEQIAAFGLTEPEAGSSLMDIQSSARPDGEGWRLNGHKTFISNVGIADFYSVLVRVDSGGDGEDSDKPAFSMFYVPADREGLTATPFEVLSPHPIGDLVLKDVYVGPEELLGVEGEGLALALANLARFRTSVAAAACGFSHRALDESRRHLSTRKQFGKPLSANQALRFDLAEMDVRLAAADLLVDRAAELVDAGEPAVAEVARAKYWATETAAYVCDRAVQHHGGLGVKKGTVVERLFREVRALRIYEGTSEIQKLILSKELLRELH